MGAVIPWKKLDTSAWRSEIVEGGRYQLASPSTVTGNPSLAMQAGQSCTVRVYIGGTLYPDASLTVNGTTPVAILNAVGQPLTGQEKFDLVIEVAMPYGQNLLTTDEPNGSPSAPFASEAQRTAWATANLASLLPGRTTAWVIVGGVAVEYVWNGPLATDWEGIRGPFPGSPANPFASTTTPAELATLAATGPDEIWIANPAVPRGKSKLVVNAARTLYAPPRGELIAGVYSAGAAPYFSGSPGVLTIAELWTGAIVPDYMIPDGLWMVSLGFITMSQASDPVGGAAFGMTLSSAPISDSSMDATIQGASAVTPAVNGTQTSTVKSAVPFARVGATFMGSPGTSGGASGQGRAIQIGEFATGATCLRFGVLASKVSDVGNIWNFEVVSAGMQ